ncbi:zinc ribbon domain-containing protein [Candidatus Bathyarchaeota archaeon]|nr:zinc ribbon domain-containing protein [Candidatus Bathyarchaeota archaeon]
MDGSSIKFSLGVSDMKNNNVATGVLFMILGVISVAIPRIGVLSPGETFDSRIAPLCFLIGFVFFIMGAMSKSDEKTIPQPIQSQPIQSQPPQRIVEILVICPKCGNRVSAESKFCPECGASLMPGKPQPT